MPELDDNDAIQMAVDYYERERGFKFEYAVRIVAILAKVDVIGLIQYAFDQGAIATNAEHISSMKR